MFEPGEIEAARKRERARQQAISEWLAQEVLDMLTRQPRVIHVNIARTDPAGVYVELLDGTDFDITVRPADGGIPEPAAEEKKAD